MHPRRLPVVASSLLLVSRAVFAEPTALVPKVASQFEPKPKAAPGLVKLQLEEADLSELVRTIGELTGKRFVIASPKLAKVKASVYAPLAVSVAEAYQAFLAVLAANGLTVVPQAGFYKIVESQDVSRQLTPLVSGELPADERYVTRVHRLAHLPAEEVATTVLAKLQTKDASVIPYGDVLIITETAANLRRMLEIVSVIDHGGEEDKLWFRPVRHLPSADVEKQLSAMLGLKTKTDAKSDAAPTTNAEGAVLHVTRIVAVERPNAIVVVGTRASFERISELTDLLDAAPSNEIKMQVVMLQHSDAKKIVGPLNEALGGAVTSSGTATGGGAPSRAAAGAVASPPVGLLEAAVRIAADETTNSLIVSATPRDFVHVREVIRALDRPKRQVFIEAAILDISVEHGTDIGVAWHGGKVDPSSIGPPGTQTTYGGWRANASGGPPSPTDLQAFALGVRGPEIPFLPAVPGLSKIPSFGLFLSAIATAKGTDILSTPTILASDNTLAEIKVQLQTSLQPNAPTVPSINPTTGLPMPTTGSVAQNYKGIGPHIKITPHLNESDEVRLDVIEVISDVQSAPGKNDTFGTVSYIERTANTTLTVKDGQTVVIGGLVRNRMARTESKVPLLGDMPVLGALFRTRNDTIEKSNLVLVLTPHIIRDEHDMKRIMERKMQERHELAEHNAIFEGNVWEAPHDWKRARGLLAHMKASYAEVEVRRKEAVELAPRDVETRAPRPLDLPMPHASPPSSPTAPAPSGGAANPSRPSVIER